MTDLGLKTYISPRSVAGLGLALLLAGCASGGKPEVACRGSLTDTQSARTYALTAIGGGPERAGIEAALNAQLAAEGFTRNDGAAAYLVEVLYGERPGQVGAYANVASTGQPDWVIKPTETPWWRSKTPVLGKVTIRFIQADTGVEAYRASASSLADARQAADVAAQRFDVLVRAALGGQPCPPPGVQAAS